MSSDFYSLSLSGVHCVCFGIVVVISPRIFLQIVFVLILLRFFLFFILFVLFLRLPRLLAVSLGSRAQLSRLTHERHSCVAKSTWTESQGIAQFDSAESSMWHTSCTDIDGLNDSRARLRAHQCPQRKQYGQVCRFFIVLGCLGVSWIHFCSFWAVSGGVLGSLGRLLGPSWRILGTSWSCLGPSWVVEFALSSTRRAVAPQSEQIWRPKREPYDKMAPKRDQNRCKQRRW